MSLKSELERRMAKADGVEKEASSVEGDASGVKEEAGDVVQQQYDQAQGRAKASSIGIKIHRVIKSDSILPTQLTMRDFEDLYSKEKIARDERYAAECERKFENESSPAAQAFEEYFVKGIQQGHWLGNTSEMSDEDAFTTQTYETTKFDDYYHKVDVFTTLHFDTPIEAWAGEISELPLGFDVTLDTRRGKIVEKLTKCSNALTPMPFGFSEVDYYSDGEQKYKCDLLPRYVIGISKEEIENLQNDANGTNPLSAGALRTRFKVLSEIRAQNLLFNSMLPDGAYESDNIQLRQAAAYIEAADDCLNRALRVCTKELIDRGRRDHSVNHDVYLPPDVIAQIDDPSNLSSPQKILEDYFIKDAQSKYEEYERKINPNFKGNGTTDDPFALIMRCTHQLHEAVKKDKERGGGPYASQGEVKVHNKPFAIPAM